MLDSGGINHLILDTFFKNGDTTEHLLYVCQFEICFTCCEMLTGRGQGKIRLCEKSVTMISLNFSVLPK